MITKDEFINFYHSQYRKIIRKTYQQYRKEYLKKRNIIILIESLLFLFLVGFAFLIYKEYFAFNDVFPLLGLFIVLYIFITVFCIKKNMDNRKEAMYSINYFIYKDMLEIISNNDYYHHGNVELTEEDFQRMDLFNLQLLKYSGDNLTASNYKGKKFVLCDVLLYDLVERIKTDRYFSDSENTLYITNYHYHDKIDIFKGLYYETTINRENNTHIYLIPNNIKDKFVLKNINNYISYHGTKVELENLDFSEKYSVFSVDEIKTRYVLSLTLMEKINQLDNLFKEKKYIVFKKDGRVSLFIDGIRIENFYEQKFSLSKSELPLNYLLKYYDNVLKLFKISEIMEDINTFKLK